MIELVFGDSPAGALKMAKSTKGGTLEGSSGDVEALTLALDIGDLSDTDTDMAERKKLFQVLFADFPGAHEKIWATNRHALQRLEEAKATLEPIRMWICARDPAEICGLHFVCHRLVDVRTPLSVVCIPAQIEKEDCIINYRNTGEISPEAFGAFTVYEAPISKLRRKVYANTWSSLVRESAPLRAVVNGSLLGVPEDFYDFALRSCMTDGTFSIVQLIGKALGQIPGIGDGWLFLRVQTMLKSGDLISVSAAKENSPYSEVVKRRGV